LTIGIHINNVEICLNRKTINTYLDIQSKYELCTESILRTRDRCGVNVIETGTRELVKKAVHIYKKILFIFHSYWTKFVRQSKHEKSN